LIAEVSRFFNGLELVDPGVVQISSGGRAPKLKPLP
jgi:S-adenosyl methyltransferase